LRQDGFAARESALLGIDQIGYPEEWKDFVARNGLFLERLPRLLKAADAVFQRKDTQLSEPIDKVLFSMGRVCLEDFSEILLLCGNGYGIAALKLLRTLYETTVTLAYLAQHPDEVDSFMDFYLISRRKLLRAIEETFPTGIIPPEDLEKAQIEFESVKQSYEVEVCSECGTKRLGHSWTKLDFVSMAKKAGPIGGLIVPGYYLPLQHAHPSVANFMSRMEESESGFTFDAGPQRDWADRALTTAHNCLLTVLDVEIAHLNIIEANELLLECVQDFKDIHASRPGSDSVGV
jgi:hypothetical protein